MADTGFDLDDFIQKSRRDGKTIFKCLGCSKEWQGRKQRCFAHLLRIEGADVGLCNKSYTSDQRTAIKQMQAEHDASRKSSKDGDEDDHILSLVEDEGQPSKKHKAAHTSKPKPNKATTTKQTTMPDFTDPQRHQQVDFAVALFFYKNGIPFNVARDRHFKNMVTAIACKATPSYTPPGSEKLRTTLLDKAYKDVGKANEKLQEQTRSYGVSIVSDGWTSTSNHPLLNFLCVTPNGPEFLHSIDASGFTKNSEYIAEQLSKAIEKVGPEHVVCVITDSAATNCNAGKLVEDKYPHIFWVRCAAHGIDLLLEQFAKEDWAFKTIEVARRIVSYITNHHATNALIREHAATGSKLAIKKPGETRFASSFIMLERLYAMKDDLQSMVDDAAWRDWVSSLPPQSKERPRKVKTILSSTTFWQRVEALVAMFEPVALMLRLADGNTPCMGRIYLSFLKLLSTIHNLPARKYLTQQVRKSMKEATETRWLWMHSPLHSIGFLLDPANLPIVHALHALAETGKPSDISCLKGMSETRANQLFASMYEDRDIVFEKMLDRQEVFEAIRQLENYITQTSVYFSKYALTDEATIKTSAWSWWSVAGRKLPLLRKVAIRVLGQVSSASACERNWSDYGYIHNKKRNRLSHSTAEKLVYVYSNLNLVANTATNDTTSRTPDFLNMAVDNVQEEETESEPASDEDGELPDTSIALSDNE